ncbi:MULTISPECIES: TonB-dependent receptor family protein [unclassified Brenneria]|uniref:TonB-dependent receptor family protein n=1 Tax=unclassified Brenneria TaxID=2634434 RepID=UPI001552DEC6|nr:MULTISPECIES: TonB-dependent siderophore receptor [unclassified Brenneria]MBJ7223942.1 TonB-dependent siderophore receptor [Brenneria sp. L3-3C-1]MEE3645186.1 TonB-dependent siderophore receptor [Brenneria sp. L3_3C_1]MEE3649931.1 TonB-dependent siderophore receptor [Brenneria sp. HEZEL_4_2_4]NPC99889.1 TonB-dependent siderophore receptor [Brenneria sp. hezel4-2-4]
MQHSRIASAVALILFSNTAWSDEGTITVNGNILGDSRAEEVKTWAGNRTVITHEQLHQGANRTLDDALQRVPGVKIQDETGTGILPQIAVRGLYDSRSGRSQILQDGIPLALAPYGQEGMSLFPTSFATIDRIDVVRGGAAVQYGPNNVGGVINLISKPIPVAWENEIAERATFFGRGRNLWDTYLRTGGMINDSFGLQLEANQVKGNSFREHSASKVQNYRIRGLWNINDETSLDLSYQYYDAHAELAGALSGADYRADRRQSTRPWDDYDGHTKRYSAVYNQQLGSLGFVDSAEFNWMFFGHQSDRDFHVGMSGVAGQTWNPALPARIVQNSPRSFNVWGTEPRLSLDIDGDSVNQQWIIGARFIKEEIDYQVKQRTLASGATATTRDWDFDDRAWAGYISNAVKLLDDRLTITPGVRFERVTEKYADKITGVNTSAQDAQWLPGLTVGYQLAPEWFLYANTQKSLRPAQVTQIVKGGDVSSELAWNYESGVRYSPADNVSLSAGLYRIDYKDQISYENTSDRFLNMGKTRHQGVELEGFWSPAALDGLKLHAGYAYLDAEQLNGQNQGKRVPYASRHQLTLDGSYAWRGTTFTLSSYYFSKSFSDAANTVRDNSTESAGQQPSYWVWNAQVSRDLYKSGRNLLSGYVAVNNLFDKEYWYRGIDTSPWGRQPAPGRSVTAGLSYKF